MVYKRPRKPPSIFDYRQEEPFDDDNDLVTITLSNGDVVHAMLDGWTKHWILDIKLLPLTLHTLGLSIESRSFRIKTCSIGQIMVVKAAGLPDYLFCRLASKGTVISLRPVRRSKRLVRGTFDHTLLDGKRRTKAIQARLSR